MLSHSCREPDPHISYLLPFIDNKSNLPFASFIAELRQICTSFKSRIKQYSSEGYDLPGFALLKGRKLNYVLQRTWENRV